MFTFALIAITLVVLLRIGFSHRAMWRRLGPSGSTTASIERAYPSVTLIRPIKGADPGYRENTEALLQQDYPGAVQILFVFDTPSDPAYPLVAQLAKASGKDARVVFAGARPAQRTGKLHAMIHAFGQARGELVAFCDSDSRPSPKLLRELVDALIERPDAGASFAPAVTLGTPTSFAEVVYGLMINTWYGAAAAEFAGEKRELPFIMGQVMVLRREALSAIGGLDAAEGQLVDDMFLGAEFNRAGFKNVMVRSPLHLVTGPLGLRALSTLLRKWMTFSRSGLPAAFVRRNALRGLDLGLLLGVLSVALLAQQADVAWFAAAALGAWTSSQVALYRRASGAGVPLRFAFWVPLVVPFVAGSLLALTRFGRSVEWRGQAYALNAAGRLAQPAVLVSGRAAATSDVASAAPPRNLSFPPRAPRPDAPVHHS